jgi:hypothetical protein
MIHSHLACIDDFFFGHFEIETKSVFSIDISSFAVIMLSEENDKNRQIAGCIYVLYPTLVSQSLRAHESSRDLRYLSTDAS